MTAKIIDGKEVSAQFRQEIAKKVAATKEEYGITPALAVILVDGDAASETYVKNKDKAAVSVGMKSYLYKFPKDVSEEELIAKIKDLNDAINIHGILVQLPLPENIDTRRIIRTINYKKDVDGFNAINVGKLSLGEVGGDNKVVVPCTPLGCIHLIKKALGDDLTGMKALVVGMSNIVGRPTARLLMRENCTITMANRFTKNLKNECLQADIIVCAAGVPNLIKADMVNNNSVVIDVGINRIALPDGKSKLVGDVDFDNVSKIVKAITPVPGGVGPMTIAYLLSNTLNCCLNLIKK